VAARGSAALPQAFNILLVKAAIDGDKPDSRKRPVRHNSQGAEKSLLARKCVVAEAVVVEPASAVEFPANREISREFCRNWPFENEASV
jgi:hypothetical protein